MATKLQKWGNSIGVRIPKSIIEQANLKVDSEVEIEHKDGKIIILPVNKSLALKDLVNQINDQNLHSEDDILPEGNEVW